MSGKMAILVVLLVSVPVLLGAFVWLFVRLRRPLGPRFEWGFSRLGGACCLALAVLVAMVPFLFAAGTKDQGPFFLLVIGPVIGLGLLGILCLLRAWPLVRWLGLVLMVLAVAAGPMMYYMRGIVLSTATSRPPSGGNTGVRDAANVFVINIVVCVVVFFAGLAIFGIGSGLRKRQQRGNKPDRKSQYKRQLPGSGN
jgi:hypothetical protein